MEGDESQREQSQNADTSMPVAFEPRTEVSNDSSGLSALSLPQPTTLQIVQPSPVSGIQQNALNNGGNQCRLYMTLADR